MSLKDLHPINLKNLPNKAGQLNLEDHQSPLSGDACLNNGIKVILGKRTSAQSLKIERPTATKRGRRSDDDTLRKATGNKDDSIEDPSSKSDLLSGADDFDNDPSNENDSSEQRRKRR